MYTSPVRKGFCNESYILFQGTFISHEIHNVIVVSLYLSLAAKMAITIYITSISRLGNTDGSIRVMNITGIWL